MANKQPRLFDVLSDTQVKLATEFYTQRPGGADPDGNYKGTLEQIKARFQSEGLAYREQLNVSSAGTFEVPAGKMVEAITLLSGTNQSFDIGTTAAGSEIASGNITANTPTTRVLWLYYDSATTIHFTGTFTAIIFIR